MRLCRALAALLLISASADCSSGSAQEKWTTYVNPRYGAAADYPADLFTKNDPPPDNDDGHTFRTADGAATLSIYGTNNIDNDTPQSYLDKYANTEGATFKQATKSYYAISGMRGGKIYYERCNFPRGEGAIGCFDIEYPADQKATFDAVVTRIGRSLRAGSP